MELLATDILTGSKATAPALNRGLAILATLGKDVPRSLENLSEELALPKASVYRLLETLTSIGIIRKNADKRYQALWQLQPIGDPMALYRQSMQSKMDLLCNSTNCTVEWYEPCAEGMRLILQSNPDNELCVKAEPGFLRDWSTEFEAVARLGAAFAEEAARITKTKAYLRNGLLKPLSQAEISRQRKAAESERTAHDTAFNTNGVRRLAAAAFDADDNFLGVLALAEIYHFNRRNLTRSFLQQLKTTLK